MSSSLADYLAKNYLTKDTLSDKKKRKKDKDKKRKRKRGEAEDGIIIADDDAMGWGDEKDGDGSDDEGTPTIVRDKSTSEFRKSTKSNWIIDPSAQPHLASKTARDDHGATEADLVLAQAAREYDAQLEDDERPTVVDSKNNAVAMMESGAHAGLQTAEQVTRAMEKRRAQEMAKFKETMAAGEGPGETIYRDASGRIINVAMARAEARRKTEEEEAKKKALEERNRGDVQLLEKEERKRELQEAKFKTLSRYKDDVELNEEQKSKELWNDPAAGFLVSKKKGLSKTGKPLYQGAYAPNRYGIRPGHKWDGVDRSTGFEKKWFMARSQKAARAELEYAWEMDE